MFQTGGLIFQAEYAEHPLSTGLPSLQTGHANYSSTISPINTCHSLSTDLCEMRMYCTLLFESHPGIFVQTSESPGRQAQFREPASMGHAR